MSKHDISKGVPITDIRVLPITLKLVERFCEALKRCKNNPDYLLAKTYTKTTILHRSYKKLNGNASWREVR